MRRKLVPIIVDIVVLATIITLAIIVLGAFMLSAEESGRTRGRGRGLQMPAGALMNPSTGAILTNPSTQAVLTDPSG